ncbi:hypothetical protein Fcan01_18883 [Folsomia candida]|uniref:Uncharacterized protein n=1 Tax=Folsomia candida TaxID=158441 RepID=A0A226DNC7_FOLCA|nr:hypothetical protein Fcan01_18883 [Folsomia candida]
MGSAYYSMLPCGRFYPQENYGEKLKCHTCKNQGNPDQLNFEEHYSPLRNLLVRKFFMTSFYFKLLPKFSISMLSETTFSNFLQDSITRVKIAVYTSHVSQWFDLLKKMRALKHLYIIRVPEFGRANFQDAGNYKLVSNYDDKNLILENLVTIKLKSLACSEHFFRFHDSDLNASLISFLKCTRNVKLLQFVGWPGKAVEVLDKVKVLGENLEILRISGGRKLGEEDIKGLTGMDFPSMKRIELNVLEEKRGGVGDHVWGKFMEKVGQKVRVVKIAWHT